MQSVESGSSVLSFPTKLVLNLVEGLEPFGEVEGGASRAYEPQNIVDVKFMVLARE